MTYKFQSNLDEIESNVYFDLYSDEDHAKMDIALNKLNR